MGERKLIDTITRFTLHCHYLRVCQTLACLLVDFAKFFSPELYNPGDLAGKVSSGEESRLWDSLAVEQNL